VIGCVTEADFPVEGKHYNGTHWLDITK